MRKILMIIILCSNILDKDLLNLCQATTNDNITYCYKIENEELKKYCLGFFEN